MIWKPLHDLLPFPLIVLIAAYGGPKCKMLCCTTWTSTETEFLDILSSNTKTKKNTYWALSYCVQESQPTIKISTILNKISLFDTTFIRDTCDCPDTDTIQSCICVNPSYFFLSVLKLKCAAKIHHFPGCKSSYAYGFIIKK